MAPGQVGDDYRGADCINYCTGVDPNTCAIYLENDDCSRNISACVKTGGSEKDCKYKSGTCSGPSACLGYDSATECPDD